SGLREKAQENGMKLWVENYGHWGFPGEFLQYGGQADLVGGEFWLDDPLGEIECRAAASAGHINGKSPIFAEAFTAPRKHYARYPGLLRQRGDWSYIQGINHHVLHVYIHQPYQDTMPGINTWFGVEFNRQNIWFPKSKSWIDYLRRNHFLLQQGNYVADVCYFIGEGAPVMTGITEPGLPEGYAFDFINADVIINDMYVKDHRLYLSNGMSYALMVLPPLKTMRPELLEKLEQLVQQGAYIYGAAPTRSPSLEHYPLADRAVQNLATNVWGMENGQKKRAFGNGLVFNNLELTDVLKEIQVEPDLLIEGTLADSILWMHRKKEDIDIYFLTNQSMKSVNVNAEFRVQKRNPEIWDAVSGEIRPLFQFANRNERIQIPLRFLPGESYYVVFSDKTSPLREVGNFTEYTEVLNLNTGWKIAFDTTRKGPMKILESQELFDWSESENDSIKYFSGSAEYRKTFEFEGDTIANYFLDVGKLCWVANVSLNGTPMGGIWTDPARIRLNGLKRGLNLLEIEVTNTWVNRLIGDSQLPEKERMTWAAENPYRPGSLLQHAGLLGPVRLLRSSD
ncbi:MAG: hypothetical protein KDC53_04460, partial [Saprospiraceae bacterium]|nr:hypothetical protein [Saprospiraceae bacterium]